MSGKPVYDGFISYSHANDRAIAAALQAIVQKLGKPWHRRRALRLFRDDTSLSATPQLWPSIEQALSRSRFLILLASPEAAASPWVGKEVAYWLDHNGVDRVLIALTEGQLDWDGTAADFRWCEATPLPPALMGHFSAEPRWIDLRSYRHDVSPRDLRFAEFGADFAAAIHGVPKEDLLSQEVRQQRRALRLAVSAAAALAILLGIAAWLGTVAETQKRAMQAQRDRAEHALVVATDAVLNLAKSFRNVGVPPIALNAVILEIRKLQDQLSVDTEVGLGVRLSQGTALYETAETLLVLGDTFDALDAAREARAQLQALVAATPANLDYLHALELSDRKLGDVLRVDGDFAGALDAYRQALAIGQSLAIRDGKNAEWQRDLFLSFSAIGLVATDRNDLPAALDAFEQAKGIALHLKELNPSAATTDSDLAWVQNALEGVRREMAGVAPQK